MDRTVEPGNPFLGNISTKLEENNKNRSIDGKASINKNTFIVEKKFNDKNIAHAKKISSFLKKYKQPLIIGGSLLPLIIALLIPIISLHKKLSIYESEKISKIEFTPRDELTYPAKFFEKLDLKNTELGHSKVHPLFITKSKKEIVQNIYVLSTSLIALDDALNNGKIEQSTLDIVKLVTTSASKSSFYQSRVMETYLHLMLTLWEVKTIAEIDGKDLDRERMDFLFDKYHLYLEDLGKYIKKTKEESPSKQNQQLQPYIDLLYPLIPLFPLHSHMMAQASADTLYPARLYVIAKGEAKDFNQKQKKILSTKSENNTLFAPLAEIFSTFSK